MKMFLILLLAAVTQASNIIDGEYLLGLKPEFDSGVFASRLRQDYGLKLINVWDIKRSKIMYLQGQVDVELISKLPEVKYMENNGWARLHQTNETCQATAHPSVWGLDRIDQQDGLSYSSPSDPSAVYEWGMHTGLGVKAYVTDTGVDITHSTFQGRAVHGYTSVGIPGTDDGYGHGTHCAGTIGGAEYGVAKDVTIVAVKVLDASGSGTAAQFVDGLNWVLEDHEAGVDRSVVSMSLGYFSRVTSIDDIIAEMSVAGIHFAASAGNENDDACLESPGGAPEVMTAAATDVNDATATFTSWGTCVEVHAPGVNVLSSIPGEGTDYFSGTSMSCPHTAGVIARYLSYTTGAPPGLEEVRGWLQDQASKEKVTFTYSSQSASPNLLLYASCSMATPK